MTLSRADQLRQRAREIEDHSWAVRWTSPDQSRALLAISRELTEMALPPAPRAQERTVRRLTITFDVAFGKEDPEQADPDEVNAFGGVDTINERRASDEHATPQIGFGGRTPWEDQ